MNRAFAAAAVFALACLLARSARVGLAGDYLDPVGRIGAQDEAVYASSAIHAAVAGGWLTPEFMGRMALYKPPLLVWMSGLSARLAGVSRLALRFPIALLCALAAGLVFWWAAEARSIQAGAAAVLLLASNHLWHVLGSMCLTDGLLAAFFTAAMYCLFADPWLESRAAFWGFAGAVGAAILTKSVAGVLPLGILALYWLAAPRNRRPALGRVCAAAGAALALAAPWFVYQALAHHRWFWTEHVAIEVLGYGAGAPPQTSQENQVLFYVMRCGGPLKRMCDWNMFICIQRIYSSGVRAAFRIVETSHVAIPERHAGKPDGKPRAKRRRHFLPVALGIGRPADRIALHARCSGARVDQAPVFRIFRDRFVSRLLIEQRVEIVHLEAGAPVGIVCVGGMSSPKSDIPTPKQPAFM